MISLSKHTAEQTERFYVLKELQITKKFVAFTEEFFQNTFDLLCIIVKKNGHKVLCWCYTFFYIINFKRKTENKNKREKQQV